MLTNVKAVLFDLDGTLIDSMWMWKDIDIEYLKKHGLSLPLDLQKNIEGMSFSEVAVYFKEEFHIPDSLEEMKAEWNRMALYKYAHEVPLKPGVLEFLKYLKSHDILTGIATSNSRELLEAALKPLGLSAYIDCTMTSCEAGAGKPSPLVYLKTADCLGVKPSECLVFEDTPAGILSGVRAQMPICAVEDANCRDRKEEIQKLANYYISDFTQILTNTYLRLK